MSVLLDFILFWRRSSNGLSSSRLAKSVHSLQTDFLSSRAAVDDRLRPLSAALDRNSKMLRHLREHLSNAAQQNQQTHKLQGGLHTLAQQYQVRHTHAHTQGRGFKKPESDSAVWLQSVQRNLSEEHLLVAGSVEDGQLLLADTFSIQEDLNNATAVRQRVTHTPLPSSPHPPSAAAAQTDPHLCVCSRWRCSAATWISGAPC